MLNRHQILNFLKGTFYKKVPFLFRYNMVILYLKYIVAYISDHGIIYFRLVFIWFFHEKMLYL